MNEPIGLSEFMRVNGMDPGAGLRAPMTASRTSSVRELIRIHTPVWDPTIKGLFRPEDIQHMRLGTEDGIPAHRFNLGDYGETKEHASDILIVVSLDADDSTRMPKPPDDRWGPTMVNLFERWVAGGMPE
jgi:hypothetical protein